MKLNIIKKIYIKYNNPIYKDKIHMISIASYITTVFYITFRL